MCWLKVRHYNGCGCNLLLEYKPCLVVTKNPSRKFTCGHIEEVVERRTNSCNQGEEITKKKPCPHNRHLAGTRDERPLVRWPAHVIIPVTGNSREDRSKEPSAQPSTPVKPSNKTNQSTPVNIRNSPSSSTPVNASNKPDQSTPVNASNKPDRSTPANASSGPDSSTLVEAGSKPDEIRIPLNEITEHGELVKDRERRQRERARNLSRQDLGTLGGPIAETSDDQESSESRENASQEDEPVMSDGEITTLKRHLNRAREDRESSKRHKSVAEGEEEVLVED